MESSEFISIEQILSDLVTLTNDEGYSRSGLDRGFYISRIHDAVTYFALETYYQTVVKDIINFDTDNNGVLNIPVNAFNIKEIYLFNGSGCNQHPEGCTCGNDIDSADYVYVHWKRTLSHTKKTGLRTMKIRQNSSSTDPVFNPVYGERNFYGSNFVPSNLYYFNLQSGKIILSENYSNYKNIRLVYNGMGSENCELPCIPRILKDGITDKAALDTFMYLKVRDKSYRVDYLDIKERFYGNNRNKGSLKECKSRISMLDSAKRESLREYLGNSDWL